MTVVCPICHLNHETEYSGGMYIVRCPDAANWGLWLLDHKAAPVENVALPSTPTVDVTRAYTPSEPVGQFTTCAPGATPFVMPRDDGADERRRREERERRNNVLSIFGIV